MSRRTRVLSALVFLPCFLIVGCAAAPPSKQSQSERGDRIAAKLAAAEALGAESCSPRELARAKAALALARHEAVEPHYPAYWTENEFAAAEETADRLLALRQEAARFGAGTRFQCVSRAGRPPGTAVR